MLQCEHCMQWCHSKCVNISLLLASKYLFICPFCVKAAVTTIANINSEILSLKARLIELEETCKHMPAQLNILENPWVLCQKK